jgi:HAMP domain-containing protein
VQSLTSRFLLIVIALFIIFATVSAVWLFVEVEHITTDIGTRYARERVASSQSQLARLLEREAALALNMASSPTILRWTQDEDDPELRAQAWAEVENYLSSFADSNVFVGIRDSLRYYSWDSNGAVTETVMSADEPADAWFFDAIATGEQLSFNLDYNPTIESSRVWVNTIAGDPEPLAVVGTGFEVTDMVSRMVSVEGDATSATLVDSSGIVLAHRDAAIMEHNARTREDAEKITVYDLVSTSEERQELRGLLDRADSENLATGSMRIGEIAGLTAAAPVYGLDAILLTTVDTSAFLSFRDFTPLFLLVFTTLVLVLAVTTYFMERIVLRPLASLTTSTERIAAGEYDLNVSATGSGEIGLLASSFQTMLEQIRRYTRNLEHLVEERTAELTAANNKMTESISYAQTIQFGIMPSESTIRQLLPGNALFFRERDTVGGDMLFLREVTGGGGRRGFVLAVVDCEGHGVSGALMTMAVHSILDHAVASCDPERPDTILQEAQSVLGSTLSSQSGFDIGLCSCFPDADHMVFAGAGMPLYVRESTGELVTVRGRGKAIRSRYRREPTPFEAHTLEITGRRFFLVTDGYVDQAGGDHGRSYGTRRLYSFFRDYDTDRQRDWESEFDRYRGETPQRDDVLAITWKFQEVTTA